ncbi:shikimate dehydrogenase [Piscinibacter sakaiensis]|uniref:shikimate dehydrogenase n=1 Tax=Piscinibacter sakaiensis TaxID=1547922 RepID=UPI003AB05BE3
MMSTTEGPTDRYAVAGNPVAHSQSPFIHATFAQATGQRLHYDRLFCPLDDFAATLRGFAASTASADGLNGPARGCNVTVPFKFQANDLATRRSDRAALALAANTLRFDPDGWYADNTDGVGLVRDIEANAGVEMRGRRVLLLGAGGGAAGALGALLQAGPSLLRIVNRTPANAQQLAQRHQPLALAHEVELQAAGLDDAGSGFDVVINATTSSLQQAAVPLPAAVLRPRGLAFDMMYGAPAQGFLQWAAEHDAVGRDGLGMLVEQAAEAFTVWRGVRPATAEVLQLLRRRLQSATA